MTKKSKTDKILDDLDKALEQMDKDLQAILDNYEKEYNQGWKDGIAVGGLWVALILGAIWAWSTFF